MSTPNTVVPVFSLGNDKPFVASLWKASSGKVVPMATGTPIAFLSTDVNDVVAPSSEHVCTIAHITRELWAVNWEASEDHDTLLTAIGTTPLYLIVIHPDGIRVVALCSFDPILYAKVKR